MEVWLLDHLSTAVLAVLVVGGIVVLSLLGDKLCRRWFPSTSGGAHNEMVALLLSVFGAIYGVILAFVIVNLWTQMQDAETVVAGEATAVAQIVRDAQALPPGPRDRINTAVGRYVHTVVEKQWPVMREGHAGHDHTASEVDGIYEALRSFAPTDSRQQIFLEHAVNSLDNVVDHRRDRIAASGQDLPALLQTLVFGGALVILPLTFMYGREDRRLETIFVGSVSALLSLSVLLVLVLDLPFSGDLSVSPAVFKEGILAQFWTAP
ncbi:MULTISPECIES: hypothetical protein [unclassified Streptomyces]|uniref:bestrophin-like domain n=1 Tax=unclassified Streptomyces TaxID=2593676 RepID=UPI003243B1FD|nr:DUF4239 domain-containing protein [Streptomyces sp. NBC_01017]WSV34929.1 DUF4239 domain-containing protein [Streptomyces sp. NBC_01017]